MPPQRDDIPRELNDASGVVIGAAIAVHRHYQTNGALKTNPSVPSVDNGLNDYGETESIGIESGGNELRSRDAVRA
jgi:hypothetical protein